jgi:hypothetical protein
MLEGKLKENKGVIHILSSEMTLVIYKIALYSVCKSQNLIEVKGV